jgi:murein DD-endopeptidase MepM/ murein hydrolase activator NlpD
MITKRTFSLVFFGSLALGGTLAATPFLNTKAASAVSGQYKGIKLPYPAGQTKQVTNDGSGHTGSGRHAIDFRMSYEDVLAIKSGEVVAAKKDQFGGQYLLIDHKDGYCSMYLHLDNNGFYVSQGQQIQQGQRIARSGNTGKSTAAHLHLAVFQKKPNQGCKTDSSQEIAMIFDEKPSGELVGGDKIVSKNGTSSNNSDIFKQRISSSIKVTQQSVNLNVCASNLPNQTVYVQTWRDAAYSYPSKEWNVNKVATSTCMDFLDLEGPRDSFSGVTYYTVASLTPIPNGEAAKKRTSCWGTTGGKYLCDAGRR